MVGPVIEYRYGQGVDAPLDRPGARWRLHAISLARASSLEEWLTQSPEDRIVIAVVPAEGWFLVLYRDREEASGGG